MAKPATTAGPNQIPGPIMDELLSAVRVEFDLLGNLKLLSLPSYRELPSLIEACGGRNLSHSTEDVAQELERAVWSVMPKWRLAYLRATGNRSTVTVNSRENPLTTIPAATVTVGGGQGSGKGSPPATVTVKKGNTPAAMAHYYGRKPQAPANSNEAQSMARLEAEVRTMPYTQLLELCKANGLEFNETAPNAGILTMRARNAVYNAIRAGHQFK